MQYLHWKKCPSCKRFYYFEVQMLKLLVILWMNTGEKHFLHLIFNIQCTFFVNYAVSANARRTGDERRIPTDLYTCYGLLLNSTRRPQDTGVSGLSMIICKAFSRESFYKCLLFLDQCRLSCRKVCWGLL